MSLLDDSFPGYCTHENIVIINRIKNIVSCLNCKRTIICNHTYGNFPLTTGIFNGTPPKYCKLCKIMIFDGFNYINH